MDCFPLKKPLLLILLPLSFYMNKEHYEKKLYTEFVRPFPNEEGNWQIVSTGEIVTAIEDEDIQGFPIMLVETSEGERLLHVDFNNEIFVKLDKNNNPLV